MPRIDPVDPGTSRDEPTRKLLEAFQERIGALPAVIRTLARSRAALEAFMAAELALGTSGLGEGLRRQVGLLAAETHACAPSLGLRAAMGRAAGLSADEVTDARRGSSPDRRIDAALRFARALLERRGRVADADVARLRQAGFGDADVVELVATVALALCADYLNHVAGTEPDYPVPPPLP